MPNYLKAWQAEPSNCKKLGGFFIYLLPCLKIKAPSINDTAIPDIPGNKINKYNIPLTPAIVRINNNPFKGVSILNAAINVNK